MALPPELQQGLLGSWSGSYRVWLEPGAEPHECETAATCAPELDDRFVAYRYDWSYDGAPQHGYALLGCTDAGEYQMAWTDTWHNGNAIMFCTGAGPDRSSPAPGPRTTPAAPGTGGPSSPSPAPTRSP